jgi:hypothetical protein
MKIGTNIRTNDPNYPYTPAQAASQVLAALGGNPANDQSVATVTKLKTHIETSVELEADDSMAYTPDGAATQILAALGANPTVDYCVVTISWPGGAGQAGTPPAPEMPATVGELAPVEVPPVES